MQEARGRSNIEKQQIGQVSPMQKVARECNRIDPTAPSPSEKRTVPGFKCCRGIIIGWKTNQGCKWHSNSKVQPNSSTYTTIVQQDYSSITKNLRLKLLTTLSDTTTSYWISFSLYTSFTKNSSLNRRVKKREKSKLEFVGAELQKTSECDAPSMSQALVLRIQISRAFVEGRNQVDRQFKLEEVRERQFFNSILVRSLNKPVRTISSRLPYSRKVALGCLV